MSLQDSLIVEVLEQKQACWQTRQADILQLCADREALQGLALILLPDRTVLSEHIRQSLSSAFDIPASSWQAQYCKATGYYQGVQGRLLNVGTAHSTAIRFLIKTPAKHATLSLGRPPQISYGWTEIGIWTQYRHAHSLVLICLISDPCKTGLAEDIRASLGQSGYPLCISHPFGWHAYVICCISRAFHTTVWKCRDFVRDIETSRSSVYKDQTDYPALHELSRHVLHSTETLSTAINVTQAILDDLTIFHARHQSSSTSLQLEEMVEVIKCQKTLLQCEHGRSQALESRLRNEIDLAFHIGTQRDSLVASRISDLARVDSASVRTISILGLVFLPGTFVSAIFGMNFFSFSRDQDGLYAWAVSSNFWLYWVITVPLTLAIILVWHFWHRPAYFSV